MRAMGLFDFLEKLSNRGERKKKETPKKAEKRIEGKTPSKVSKKPQEKTQGETKKKTQKKAEKSIHRKTQQKPHKAAQSKKPYKSSGRTQRKAKEKEIGVITHYFGKISVGIVKLKISLKAGDKIHIKGAYDDFSQVVKSMQLNHQSILKAKKGDEVGIEVIQRVHENDKVYRVAEE